MRLVASQIGFDESLHLLQFRSKNWPLTSSDWLYLDKAARTVSEVFFDSAVSEQPDPHFLCIDFGLSGLFSVLGLCGHMKPDHPSATTVPTYTVLQLRIPAERGVCVSR